MKKPGKRKALLVNWEGPYAFMKYNNNNKG